MEKKRLQRFWEKCGFRFKLSGSENPHYWINPQGKAMNRLPPIDLNNLVEYAVPQVMKLGYKPYAHYVKKTKNHDEGWCVNLTWLAWLGGKRRQRVTNSDYEAIDKDPATALFLACEEVFNG